MNRRAAIQTLTIATGGAMLLPMASFSGCKADTYTALFFAQEDLSLLNEFGETILPETARSIGAKSLKIARFMDGIIADCFTGKHQELISLGLDQFKQQCLEKYAKGFEEILPDQQFEFLETLELASKASKEPHYYAMLKSLVLFGYFTSEEGSSQVLRYLPVPGKYIGNYPLKEGETSWAL